jgi:hypothetical protein
MRKLILDILAQLSWLLFGKLGFHIVVPMSRLGKLSFLKQLLESREALVSKSQMKEPALDMQGAGFKSQPGFGIELWEPVSESSSGSRFRKPDLKSSLGIISEASNGVQFHNPVPEFGSGISFVTFASVS